MIKIKQQILWQFILLPFVILTANAQKESIPKWTDIFNAKSGNIKDFEKSYEKQEKTWQKQDKKARRRGEVIAEHSGEEIFQRWLAYKKPRVYPSGDISLTANTYSNFLEWQKENQSDFKKTRAGNWTALGPVGKPNTPAGQAYRTGTGRLNFITIDPNNTQIIFVGTPDGGMWKTTNGGTSWTNMNDFLTVIGCCDLVIDPSNSQIMYLATGDIEGDRRSVGILKTVNGGTSWTPTSITWTIQDNWKTSKLRMDPANSQKMILSTDGGTFSTTDGWVTNTQGTFPAGNPALKDMELKPNDANTVYASGTKLYKSTDFGINWNEITTGLPNSNISRIALAVSPANSNYVYALYGKQSDQSFMGLYRSVNSGTSFSTQYTGPLNLLGYDLNGLDLGSGQAFYDLEMEVNPADANKVTLASINQWQTSNGGTSWTIKSHWTGAGGKPTVHSDFHCIQYEPGSSTTLYSGSDGGLWKSTDDGVTWNDISNNLNISQVNKLGVSQSDANLNIAGMQDNGTNVKNGATWGNIFGGDGGESFIDWNDDNTLYYCYVKSEVHRSDDGGTSDNQVTTGLPNGGSEDFYSSFHQDPTVSSRIYAGGHLELYRSNNKGDNWTMLGTPSGADNITEFAIAPSNNQIIYSVKSDAVSKSTNGGTTWTDITGTIPAATASPVMVAVSNTDPQKVWVVLSGYSAGDKVFKSVDGGTSWTNISAGLPNLPMNTVVSVNNSLTDAIYVGADIGVYYISNATPTAVSYITNLPNVSVRDLEIQYLTGKLRAATYGRGIWESDTLVNIPLPINLISFTGTHNSSSNKIQWTSVENELSHYELERSRDGKFFDKITSVDAKENNTNQEANYTYIDTKIIASVYYYRLKSVDIDGKSNYSNVIKLTSDDVASIKLYPNPADGNITLTVKNTPYQLVIKDINGRTVFTQHSNNQELVIDTHAYPVGMYFVHVLSDDNTVDYSQSIEIKH